MVVILKINSKLSMKKKQTYKMNDQGEFIIPGPRSTNEIFVTEVSKGSMPNNEKDASTFSLIGESSVISSLKSIYTKLEGFSYKLSGK